jgi:hypothetical protein
MGTVSKPFIDRTGIESARLMSGHRNPLTPEERHRDIEPTNGNAFPLVHNEPRR